MVRLIRYFVDVLQLTFLYTNPVFQRLIMPISGKSISLFSIYTLMLQIQVEFKAKYTWELRTWEYGWFILLILCTNSWVLDVTTFGTDYTFHN